MLSITLESYGNRYILIGPTYENRVLAIVVEPEKKSSDFYVVTARSASRKELKLYLHFREMRDLNL